VDLSPSGRLLGVEPDYLLDQRYYFSHVWIPVPDGVIGGPWPPHLCCRGVQGGS